MTFTEKISSIETLLGNGHFRNKTILACAIYYKIKFAVSFRKLPLQGTSYTWFNLRYWLQKLQNEGKLQKIKSIVGGGD